MDTNYKITVILPSYNVANYITECVNSVLQQSYDNLEILCIDAKSNDGTYEILKDFEKKDARIRVITSSKKSYGKQVNDGFSMATGEYLAVVETDDYIEQDMYSKLIEIAKHTDADYIKAEYNEFYEAENREKIWKSSKSFAGEEYYDSLIKPHQCSDIYKHDFNIWRGIYRRKFIEDNNIYLNETDGAAFQDIGFMEQVLAHAQNAWYIQEPLYWYRRGREGASVNSSKAFYNTYYEFRELFENKKIYNSIYKKCFYIHMTLSFLNEYSNCIKRGEAFFNGEVQEYAEWFKNQIRNAIKNNLINQSDFSQEEYYSLEQVLNDTNNYICSLKNEKEQEEEAYKLILDIKERQTIIFGAGYWGIQFFVYIINNLDCEVLAFADNNPEAARIGGISVLHPEDCINKYPNVLCVVANKKYGKEMEEQYKELSNNTCKIMRLF